MSRLVDLAVIELDQLAVGKMGVAPECYDGLSPIVGRLPAKNPHPCRSDAAEVSRRPSCLTVLRRMLARRLDHPRRPPCWAPAIFSTAIGVGWPQTPQRHLRLAPFPRTFSGSREAPSTLPSGLVTISISVLAFGAGFLLEPGDDGIQLQEDKAVEIQQRLQAHSRKTLEHRRLALSAALKGILRLIIRAPGTSQLDACQLGPGDGKRICLAAVIVEDGELIGRAGLVV